MLMMTPRCSNNRYFVPCLLFLVASPIHVAIWFVIGLKTWSWRTFLKRCGGSAADIFSLVQTLQLGQAGLSFVSLRRLLGCARCPVD
ncbi:hypothetical protein [Marinobacter sp. X15-166B]|uniref:hypothetical protein n=1 Tax=Marinobacter sp. X15-166B TaxID=1897620 RepID=UPI00114CAB84|nr:hypothetical protein [Marinobacter sp. X15-166B]